MFMLKILKIAMACVVAVIAITAILIPIVDNTTNIVEYNNYGNSAASMADLSDNEIITITATWDRNIGGVYTWAVNDEIQNEFIFNDKTRAYLLMADTLYISAVTNASGEITANGLGVDYLVDAQNARGVIYGYSISMVIHADYVDLTIISNSGVTTNLSIPYNWLYYGSDNGDYRLIYAPENQGIYYYNSLSDIHGSNFIVANNNRWFSFSDDKVTVYGIGDINAKVSSTRVGENVNYISFSRVASSYISGYQFDITLDDDSIYTVTPYNYVVPYHVAGEPIGVSPISAQLIQLVPIIMVVGLIIGLVGVVISRKLE